MKTPYLLKGLTFDKKANEWVIAMFLKTFGGLEIFFDIPDTSNGQPPTIFLETTIESPGSLIPFFTISFSLKPVEIDLAWFNSGMGGFFTYRWLSEKNRTFLCFKSSVTKITICLDPHPEE